MKKKHYASRIHLGIGMQSFGNSTTILAKPNRITLLIMDQGVLMTHSELKLKVMVPYANIKGMDLLYSSEFGDDVGEDAPTNQVDQPLKEVISPLKQGKK